MFLAVRDVDHNTYRYEPVFTMEFGFAISALVSSSQFGYVY